MAADTGGAQHQKYANATKDIMVRPVAEVTKQCKTFCAQDKVSKIKISNVI